MTHQILKRSIWTLVRHQHGVVTRQQLLAHGFTGEAIKHRVASGRLHPVHRGVYAVGRPVIDQKGRWMAAVLACGKGAVLSHSSAAALFEIRPVCAVVEVSVEGFRNVPGIRAHRRRNLTEIGRFDNIPVTSPALTLIDLATQLSDTALERAVDEADARHVISVPALRDALEQQTCRPGLARLKKLIDASTFTLTDSVLERLFLPLAQQAGLPTASAITARPHNRRGTTSVTTPTSPTASPPSASPTARSGTSHSTWSTPCER